MIEHVRKFLAMNALDSKRLERTAKLLDSFTLISLAISLPIFLIIVITRPTIIGLLIMLIFILATLGVRLGLRRGYVQQASWLYATLVWILVTSSIVNFGGIQSSNTSSLILVVLLAGLLLGRQAVIGYGLLGILTMGAISYIDAVNIFDMTFSETLFDSWLFRSLNLLFAMGLIYQYVRNIYEALAQSQQNEEEARKNNQALEATRKSLEDQVNRRTRFLQTSTEITREITTILDTDELLAHVVRRIQNEFGYYHVQIYLVEEGSSDLILAGGSSEIGEQLKAKKHRLAAGEGIVGTVASINEHFLSNNVSDVLNFVRNPLLPLTNSELAVPLRKGSNVMGVLDIQSEHLNAFSQSDVASIQSIANQTAASFDNIRLLEQMQRAVEDRERLNRRLTRQGWSELIEDTPYRAYRFTGGETQETEPVPDVAYASMPEAAQQGRAITKSNTNGGPPEAEISVPLILRGQVIGIMGVKKRETGTWANEELEAIESVANQTSLALENARLAREQEKTIIQLRDVDQLKSEFLTSMSHELRTPLNSIIGFADILLQGIDGPLTENAETDISAIHSSGKHLLALINTLLDLSKIEAGRMELVNSALSISDFFNDVASSTASLLVDKPVELIIDPTEDLPKIWADPLRISQIVINLVSNGIKFTSEGSVTLGAEVNSESMMQISVTDTGIGIPEDKFGLVFEHFRQVDARTNRKFQGSGMGLAIAKNLAELHGGTMWVESVEGVGSTFSFTVPLATKAQISQTQAEEVE